MKIVLLNVIFSLLAFLIDLAELIDEEKTHEVFRKFSIINLIKSGDLVEEAE